MSAKYPESSDSPSSSEQEEFEKKPVGKQNPIYARKPSNSDDSSRDDEDDDEEEDAGADLPLNVQLAVQHDLLGKIEALNRKPAARGKAEEGRGSEEEDLGGLGLSILKASKQARCYPTATTTALTAKSNKPTKLTELTGQPRKGKKRAPVGQGSKRPAKKKPAPNKPQDPRFGKRTREKTMTENKITDFYRRLVYHQLPSGSYEWGLACSWNNNRFTIVFENGWQIWDASWAEYEHMQKMAKRLEFKIREERRVRLVKQFHDKYDNWRFHPAFGNLYREWSFPDGGLDDLSYGGDSAIDGNM